MKYVPIDKNILDRIQSIKENPSDFSFFDCNKKFVNIELFMLFLAFGFKMNEKEDAGPFTPSIPIARFEEIHALNRIIVHGIAYNDTNDTKLLVDFEEAIKIANQYAKGGMNLFFSMPLSEQERVISLHLGKMY